MIARLRPTCLTALAMALAIDPASATGRGQPPAIVGRCAFTTISWVGQRLGDGSGRPLVPSSGSAVTLANGVRGVSYEDVPAVDASHVGDRVMTCLARVPRHCPVGDRRGTWYTTTNLRTDQAWMLPDAEHMCGGA